MLKLIPFLLLLSLPSLIVISLPTGISVFNGPIYTNSVLGFVNITSLLAYNSSARNLQVPLYGASLQLNVMLVANSTNGAYYFWLQNVADFITNESQFFFGDNVWNTTFPFSGVSNITGRGNVYSTNTPLYHSSYYAYSTNIMNYTLPLSFYLIINESYNISGVKVSFGYVILQNGKLLPPNPVFYDNVFIPVSGIISASIVVANQTTPNITVGLTTYIGNYLDAELVWGGFSNGEITTFIKMSSLLALYYMKDGNWVPFSEVYTYGLNTAESSTNLHVTIYKNGDAYVTIGKPDYGLLTSNFNPSIPGFLFLNISSKIPFIINGSLTDNFTGYVNSLIRLEFYDNYSINSTSFALLNGSYPSLIYPTNWFKNLTINPEYTYYYLIRVNSPIPVIANVNGKLVRLNSSNWLVQGSLIRIINYTYYNNSNERIIIVSVYPSTSLKIIEPTVINITTITQYKVNVKSNISVFILENGEKFKLNDSIWVNEGTNITLEANIPFYYVGKFIGTYNVSPGQSVLVNGPINESLVLYPNIPIIIIILLTPLIILAFVIIKKKEIVN